MVVDREMGNGAEGLVLHLTTRSKGSDHLVARRALTPSDALLARDETWWQGVRAGALGADLAAITTRLLPGENRGADRVAGYSVELSGEGCCFRRGFSLASLAPVAQRMVAALLKGREATEQDEFHYYLASLRLDAGGDGHLNPSPDRLDEGVRARRRQEPLVFERAPLADFLARSEDLPGASAQGSDAGERPMPVFVSAEVWEQGHDLARRGGERESAAVWTGRLFRDAESHEVFLVLDACLEAEYATEEKYAVTFSGETWGRLRERLALRRQRLNRPAERFVGVVHGHNFFPEAGEAGNRRCEACALAEVCTRTTAAASAADLDWHRAVFVGQPWAVSLIWGFNAREEEEWTMYGLANATLTPRTMRRLTS